ncbi:hypothetical protein EV210_101164 [Anaerospora hongkongensis]|uniref:Uncharacterized protein n=1 Tax=Anaerospora hongkongensis TaxID=244830 RepID=A0A4R1Q5X8_9FIRM|nr:hypothetical protein [Anaerospora hongkongensis]TCL39966.1 hypothetical protein EV210_101164 [Anaerospora hongkongensis]
MPKVFKIPVEVDAELYQLGMEDGFKPEEGCYSEFGVDLSGCSRQENQGCGGCKCFRPYIATREGPIFISPDDHIITGVEGERYAIKPGIYAKTYREVGDRPILTVRVCWHDNNVTDFDCKSVEDYSDCYVLKGDNGYQTSVPKGGVRYITQKEKVKKVESDPT